MCAYGRVERGRVYAAVDVLGAAGGSGWPYSVKVRAVYSGRHGDAAELWEAAAWEARVCLLWGSASASDSFHINLAVSRGGGEEGLSAVF